MYPCVLYLKLTNNLIIIYGENGAGKSNLVEVFYFLKDTMYTVRNRNRFEEFKDTFNKEDSREQLLLLEQRIRYDISNYNLTELVNDVRCVGTKENMEVEYGFNIDGYSI